jgi:heptosyltransferase-1
MPHVLLVKTSSLGDVIHNLPVVSDIRAHFPEAIIDWVVEEAYVPIVGLHSGVQRVIPFALRRWRGRIFDPSAWRELGEFRRLLRIENYDAVIDTQALLKSALISRAARGHRHGFDADCARERWAASLYDSTHHVPAGQHAVVRNRRLAAEALGYSDDEQADYGLPPQVRQKRDSYCVFLHGTSRADKLWPAQSWIDLGRVMEVQGMKCVLPWGSEAERQRSLHIAEGLRRGQVPPLMPLQNVVPLLSGAAFVVGVDTGLLHLAAALAVPVVGIYVATQPALTGVFGCPLSRNLGGAEKDCPSPRDVMDALAGLGVL